MAKYSAKAAIKLQITNQTVFSSNDTPTDPLKTYFSKLFFSFISKGDTLYILVCS